MNKLRQNLNGEPLWGLPQQISDEIVDAHGHILVRLLSYFPLVYLVGGFALGGLFLKPWLENINSQKAIEKAVEFGASMYTVNFGIGLILGLFTWIFAMMQLGNLTLRLLPMPMKVAAFSSSLARRGTREFYAPQITQLMTKSPKIKTASELIDKWTSNSIMKMNKIFFILLFLTIAVTYREIHTFNAYGDKGFIRSSFFTGETTYTWDEVKSVNTGCRKNDYESNFYYDIRLTYGQPMPLHTAISINNTKWLDNLEKIDAKITAGNAKHTRTGSRNPECLSRYYEELGSEDIKRLKKLLRIKSN